ncbi:MAG: glycosyltransferase family 4 protein [Herpetosiphonaceae bacterium]|nr:glycosyltransferase family 4 protein [Herpetosiphonaceae bacterium]
MKIAVWHNLPSGGGKRALYDHVRGLVKRGHTVESWCPPTADQTYLPLSSIIREHVIPLRWTVPARHPANRLLPLSWNTATQLKAMEQHCRQCAAEINRGGYDLLFANSCMFFRTPPISRFTKIPKLLYLQEPARWLYEAMPRLPWIALPSPGKRWSHLTHLKTFVKHMIKLRGYRIQAREELANAQAFTLILVNSLFSRESVLRVYGIDSKVCYLGVNMDTFVNRHQEREHFVVGIGAFVLEKNIHLVINALACVTHPRPHLVWIGNVADPAYLAELQQLAHSLGVAFEPKLRIDDHELIDLLNRAKMMVYAPRLEPFGYAPLEANACGLPVIAVAEGGVRETIKDGVNGLLVEHDAHAMAMAIQRLLNEPSYAQQLGGQGYALIAEEWSVDAAISRLERRLMELAKYDIAGHLAHV